MGFGSLRQVTVSQSWCVSFCCVALSFAMYWLGSLVGSCYVSVLHGDVRFGGEWQSGFVADGFVESCQGLSWQSWHVPARYGLSLCGRDCSGSQGVASLAKFWKRKECSVAV